MDRVKLAKFVVLTSVLMVTAAVLLGTAISAATGGEGNEAKVAPKESGSAGTATGIIAIAIAVSVASGALGAGYAVGKVGSAAIGAASERPELMGRALVFVVIAEGIAVWGLVGAILLVGKL